MNARGVFAREVACVEAVCLLGEGEVVLGVEATQLVLFAARRQTFARIPANRLQHPEALVRMAQEALLDERLQRAQLGARHLFGRFECAAAAEDRQSREEVSLALVEQIVTPGDGGAQGLLAWVRVAAALEQVEALRQAVEDLPW